jgi:hypothetical protein
MYACAFILPVGQLKTQETTEEKLPKTQINSLISMTPTIPDNWNKVTIEDYVAFMKSLPGKDEEIAATELLDQQILRACYITGCEIEEAENLTTAEYSKVNKLAGTSLPQQLKLTFKLKGIRYRLLYQSKKITGKRLKAIKTLDARKMDGGEYAAQMNCAKRGYLDSLHQVMFNLSEPLKWGLRKKFPFIGYYPYEFKDYEIEDRINDFKSLPMEVANPAAVFFCEVSKRLMTALEDFSIREMKKMTRKMKALEEELTASSDG